MITQTKDEAKEYIRREIINLIIIIIIIITSGGGAPHAGPT